MDTTSATATATDEDDASKAKVRASARHRKRKRHNYNAVRSQMEFYFGDANLSKDRFLKQMIDKDPFVPLEVFLTFNKMKMLNTSVEEIVKSLTNSQLLELDETQHKVRRKTALPLDRNVDGKTLYVEVLPPSADHEWVRQVFERFGVVSYVSLPKYAKSRKIKEFGFVEFEQENSVEKAVNAFKEFNGVLCMQDPSELKSVKAYIKEQKQEEAANEALDNVKNAKKRHNAFDEEDEEPKPKRTKCRVDDLSDNAAVDEDEDSTASETADDTEANDESKKMQQDGNEPAKKKRRKKKIKSKSEKSKNADLSADATVSYYELKILPKRDWKRLRNKYLNLQREKIAELKRKAWKERQQAEQQAKANATDTGDATAPPAIKKSKPNERKLQKMNMNFYGAGEDEPLQPKALMMKETKENPALERAPLFSYEPGLIVEVGFLEPCVNVKEFKNDMRQYESVKYIDVKEGAMYAHLRLDTAESANDFVGKVSCAEYKCKVLLTDAETEYWKKIELDREMKLNKQVKVPQKRGREKVKKLVAKHIRFSDDDDR